MAKNRTTRRLEAIERARASYKSRPYRQREYGLEDYLDLFRTKDGIERRYYASQEAHHRLINAVQDSTDHV